nr:tetratricopeptide repeat protein 12-like [Onthophagus taurus]
MEQLLKNSEDHHLNEEFNNFMHRVNEVGRIVKKLSATDRSEQKMGILEADNYLKHMNEDVLENIDEETAILKIKSERTLINKKALEEPKDENTMSQEAFMASVSKDADKRYKDRLVRKEKMETFKKQAGLAFRRGEFEKALNCYNKAIEQIKDNVTLYNNRALTLINLKMYDDAIKDTDLALRLEEDHLRSQLLQCKALFLKGDVKKFEDLMVDIKNIHSNQIEF